MIPDRQSVAAQVDEMRRIGSDIQQVEVKESVGKLPASMGETVSAFCNGSGGTIILGLSERNGFKFAEGFEAKKMADSFAELCSNKMEPPVRPETDIVKFEGNDIFVAWIEGLDLRDKPCYIRERGMYKGSYIRVSDGDHRLSSYEIDRLLENKEQPYHDIEVVSEATLADLDRELLEGLIKRQRQLHPRVFAHQSDEELLLNLRILGRAKDDVLHPTLAGLLALGSYPQRFFPRLSVAFAAYAEEEGRAEGRAGGPAGSRANTCIDSRTMAGPIPLVLEETVIAVRENMLKLDAIEDTALPEAPDYPLPAVQEAVVNALMHRDYSPAARGMQIRVNLYSDRLEVLSPGGLYGTIAVDDAEQVGRAAMRNQFLSSILETTPYGDGFVAGNTGSGFQMMQEELAEAGLAQPQVTSTLSVFTISFFKRKDDDVAAAGGVGQSAGAGTSVGAEGSDPIVSYLAQAGEAGAAEIAEQLDMSRSTVNYRLKKLVESGAIQRIGLPRSPMQTYRLKS